MKIPLDFDKEEMRVTVIASVKLKGHPALPAPFVVDTGSPVTFIDEFYSSKVRVLTKNLTYDHDALMGGTRIGMYKAEIDDLSFLNDKEDLFRINCKMFVSKTEWTRKGKTYTPTSIMGIDLLYENGFRLVLDLAKNQAFMEKT